MEALTSLSRTEEQLLQVHSRSFSCNSLLILPQFEQVFDDGANLPIRMMFLPYQSALYSNSECPFFEINRVKKAVWSLPGSIVIDNINWEIVYKEDFIGDKVAKIPDSIRHKDNSEIVYPELPFKEKTIDEMTNEEIDKLIEEKMRNAKGKSNSNP